ncbi:SLOG family protein [Streptomyces globisporus]|uniref:SLOG family protein n=1 Tax=Streptomyces globisporus TaxID=1908 RepID=UPI003680E31E
MFTVIVTGSRDLEDEQKVFRALEDLWIDRVGPLFVRHGACPTGADRFASIWCDFWTKGVFEIPHPANWEKFGKAAGPIRNREMAQAGADLCLAFPLGESRGTWNCVNECKKAGIPVMVIE